jgi:hypothetical protein
MKPTAKLDSMTFLFYGVGYPILSPSVYRAHGGSLAYEVWWVTGAWGGGGVKEVGVKMDAQQGNNLPPHGAKYEYHEGRTRDRIIEKIQNCTSLDIMYNAQTLNIVNKPLIFFLPDCHMTNVQIISKLITMNTFRCFSFYKQIYPL